jgi:hypothetical protein
LIETLAPSPQPAVIEVKPGEPQAAASAEPTPEQTTIISDLHWLVHQGHVIEFADGRMDTAKKPLPRPLKPEKKSAEEKPVAEGEVVASAVEPEGETPILTEAEIPAPEPAPVVEPASEIPAPVETTVPTVEPVAETGATPS